MGVGRSAGSSVCERGCGSCGRGCRRAVARWTRAVRGRRRGQPPAAPPVSAAAADHAPCGHRAARRPLAGSLRPLRRRTVSLSASVACNSQTRVLLLCLSKPCRPRPSDSLSSAPLSRQPAVLAPSRRVLPFGPLSGWVPPFCTPRSPVRSPEDRQSAALHRHEQYRRLSAAHTLTHGRELTVDMLRSGPARCELQQCSPAMQGSAPCSLVRGGGAATSK